MRERVDQGKSVELVELADMIVDRSDCPESN